MAVRGWGGSIASAIGIAACAGAAQLGLGYGLGIITWLPAADRAGEAAWAASLAWAAWVAATSTVAGAIGAHRLTADVDPESRGAAALLSRFSLSLAAAVGALVTVALVAVPARAAVRADAFSPQTIAAGYAVIGVLVGLVFAVWTLSSSAAATNVIATTGWLWFLAIVSVVEGVVAGRGLEAAQLGVWQITDGSGAFWFRDYIYWPGAALSLGSAFVIGALAARAAARDPFRRVGAAVSGVVGPLLVAVAYFLAAPRLAGIRAEQVSAHLLAPYAVLAGLAGSVLVTSLAQRADSARLAAAPTIPGQRDDVDDSPSIREHVQTSPDLPSNGDSSGHDGTARVDSPPADDRSLSGSPRSESRFGAASPYADDFAEVGSGEPKETRPRTSTATPLWPEGTAPGESPPPPPKPERKSRRLGKRGP